MERNVRIVKLHRSVQPVQPCARWRNIHTTNTVRHWLWKLKVNT